MKFTIENEVIRISVASRGAELQSLFDKTTAIEYMWDGNPEFWAKKSPLLFPIVGTLKNDTYHFGGQNYQLSRHGFAREKEFGLKEQTSNSLLFSLNSDKASLEVFPFKFQFLMLYTIEGKSLRATYIIKNTDDDPMYFSVGGHPAFKIPMFDGDSYEDYVLEFAQPETAGRWPISEGGLIDRQAIPLLDNTNTLQLTKELFGKDAVVLKNLKSDSVKLISKNTNKGIHFNFQGFPYLGIWAAKNADFVCIEPWCGIADSVDTNQSLIEKEGINMLAKGAVFERTWSVSLTENK